MREDVVGRANVEDTPELKAYYKDLEKYETGALWTVANKIEPWAPQSASVPVLWRYSDLREHVMRSVELVSPEKAGRRVIYLNNPGRRDVSAAVGWLYSGLQVMHPGEVASAHAHSASALRVIMQGSGAYPGVRPASGRWSKDDSPLFKYEWEPTYESLTKYAAATEGSPFDGILMNYVNPITGGHVMQTIGASMQLLRPGEKTKAHRHTRSIIYQVAKGSGHSIVAV